MLVEPSRSVKRLQCPWARFATLSEQACSVADVLMYMTDRDRPALLEALHNNQRLVQLKPFLAVAANSLPVINQQREHTQRLISVAMHRHGAKLDSYRAVAKALEFLTTPDWSYAIVGDGPANNEVRALFEPFGDRVTFYGRLEHAELDKTYRNSDVFIWPGIDEAFGMVYLEAQAQGLPVVAEDRPGVRDVIASSESLLPGNNPKAFAQAIDKLLLSPQHRHKTGRRAQQYVKDHHLLASATTKLATEITRLLESAS